MFECKRYRCEVQVEYWGNKLSFKIQQVMAIIINYINPINNVTTNLYWCKVKVKLYITVPQVEYSLEITIFVEIQLNYSFLSDPDTKITGSSSKWMFFYEKIAKFAILGYTIILNLSWYPYKDSVVNQDGLKTNIILLTDCTQTTKSFKNPDIMFAF